MVARNVEPTGVERPLSEHETLVSKTDLTGRITFVNEVFERVSGYAAAELVGQPHSIVRHPEMPRCVFKLLWDTIEAGGELFAYILDFAKNGDHCWVFAHVTPEIDPDGRILGYRSDGRKADPAQLAKIVPIYEALVAEELRAPDARQGMLAAHRQLLEKLRKKRIAFDESVFSLR
jgi:PAS domain S-box-containing protein